MAQYPPSRPSVLLATRITGTLCRRSQSAKARSAGVIPPRASTTKSARSARRSASSEEARIRPGSVSGAASSNPAVSTSSTSRPPIRAGASLRSRVTPGVSSTMAMRRPARRLNRVDLPTLGRPRMTTVGGMAGYLGHAALRRTGRSPRPGNAGRCRTALWPSVRAGADASVHWLAKVAWMTGAPGVKRKAAPTAIARQNRCDNV